MLDLKGRENKYAISCLALPLFRWTLVRVYNLLPKSRRPASRSVNVALLPFRFLRGLNGFGLCLRWWIGFGRYTELFNGLFKIKLLKERTVSSDVGFAVDFAGSVSVRVRFDLICWSYYCDGLGILDAARLGLDAEAKWSHDHKLMVTYHVQWSQLQIGQKEIQCIDLGIHVTNKT